MSIFQQIYVNISRKCKYVDNLMSILQKHVNVLLNACPKHALLGIIKKVGPSGRPFGAPSLHAGKVGIICYLEPGPPLYIERERDLHIQYLYIPGCWSWEP